MRWALGFSGFSIKFPDGPQPDSHSLRSRKPPLSSRTVGFPKSGWRQQLVSRDPSPPIQKLKCLLTFAPSMLCLVSLSTLSEVVTASRPSVSGQCFLSSARCCRKPLCLLLVLPLAVQYLVLHQRTLLLFPRSYGLMRQSYPLPSPVVVPRRRVFAGRRKSLLGVGPSRRCLCVSFPTCLDPYPGCPRSALTRFFLRGSGLPPVTTRSAVSKDPYSDFYREGISRLQSFRYVQARSFARHLGRSHHKLVSW